MSKYVKVADIEKCKMTLMDVGASDYDRGQVEGWNSAIDMIVTELATSTPRGSKVAPEMEWLHELRLDRGYSQRQLAIKTGIAQATLAKYETGDGQPTVKNAKKIADVLGFNWTRFYEEEVQE